MLNLNSNLRYEYDVDKEFTQLVILAEDGEETPLGVINWFAVHATSMLKDNRLISSDHKGWASVVMEKAMNPAGTQIGKVRVHT